MALTATFAADFTQFTASLNKANVQLTVFDRAAKNATRGLTREIESVSGQKIAVEAARMVEAINRVGGVSKLTETELRRLTNTLNEAANKAGRLGEALPPSIAKMRAEITQLGPATTAATKGMGSLGSIVGRLGPLLPVTSIAGAGAALIGMGKAALDSAGRIRDLATRTGFSTEAIQRMQAVANQTSTSLEAFTKSATTLGVNIANGTIKARDAVKDLGLSYVQLASLKPEDQFHAVIAALEKEENVAKRNAIGRALFGRQWDEIAAGIAQGYTDVANAASVSTDAQIKALDRAGDAWQKFKDGIGAGVRSIMGNIVLMAESLGTGLTNLTDQERQLIAVTKKNGGDMQAVIDQIQRAHARTTDIVLNAATAQGAAQRNYVKELAEVEKKIRSLDPAQKAQLDAALKLTGATEELGDAFNLTEAELRLYQASVRGSAQATKEYSRDTDKAAEAQKKFLESVKATTPILTAFLAPLKTGMKDAGKELQNIANGLEGNGDLISRSLNEAALATKAADDAFMEWAKTNGVLITSIEDTREGIEEATEATRAWQDNISTLASAFVQMSHVSDGALGTVAGGIARVLTALDTAIGSVKSFRDGFSQFKEGNVFAGVLGMATGVAGMVGAVASLLKGWFGVSKAVQQSRNELEGFQEILRGTLTETQRATLKGWQQDIVAISKAYVMMGRTVKEAEAAAAAMWDTDNPERSRRAIEEINRVLRESARLFDEAKESAGELFGDITNLAGDAGGIPDFLRPYIDQMEELGLLTKEQARTLRDLGDSGATNWAKVKEAADKYGVRLESLGTAFNAQRIIGDATGIINAFDMITKAGGDVGGVLFDMQEEISKVVQDALKFGTEIPENMKPWIEELKRAGFLVDEHGEKIEDLGAIKYGEKIKTEAEKSREAFEKIVEKIQELIDKITGPLMDALGDIPRDIRIKAGVDYDSGTLPPPRDDVAHTTGASSALGGRVSAALARSSSAGGGVYHVHVDVDGRQVTQVVIDRLGNRLSLLGGR